MQNCIHIGRRVKGNVPGIPGTHVVDHSPRYSGGGAAERRSPAETYGKRERIDALHRGGSGRVERRKVSVKGSEGVIYFATFMTVSRRTAPGPRGSLVAGSYRDYRRDPLGFFLDAGLRWGDLVRFRFVYKPAFLVTEPSYIKHVLQDRRQNYIKGISYDSLRLLLGEGLLVSEGDLWKRQRKLAQPIFHRNRMEEKLAIMTGCVESLLDRWRERREPFDVVADMMRLAFDIVGRALMGADIVEERLEVERVLNDAIEYVYRHMEAPFKLPPSLPTRANRRFRECLRTLDGVVARVLARHRAGQGESGTLLSLLMKARDDETGRGMSDRQLRDEILTFLLAGHETTADALVWTWTLLSDHPEIEDRLHAELDAVLGGRAPRVEDLAKLAYTGQVIDESMRIYPPAWSFTRSAVEEDELGGYRIPKGSIVIVSPYVNHRLPRFWSDPARFDPERFLPEKAEALDTYAYFPFGGGPHTCIGKHLSLLEVKVGLAMIAQRFRVRVLPDQDRTPLPRISLRPKEKIAVQIEPR